MNKKRSAEKELMDNPELSMSELSEVFNDINRLNRFLMGSILTKKKLWKTVKADLNRNYRIYDFGCGDGELLRELTLFLRKIQVKFEMIGLDISEKALSIAKNKSMDYPEISYAQINILNDNSSIIQCDILLCGLTLHHFKNVDIPELLKKLIAITKQEIIINDLKRSRMAEFWFKIISTLFLKTDIARNDGLVSIKSGFTKPEIHKFSESLPTVNHMVKWFPNFRFIWSMQHQQFI